jgi:threonine/homoserine/homoserine lactone efflux protein
MNNWLLPLGLGIAGGIFGSAPIGPTELWLTNAVLPPRKSSSSIIAFVVGIIIMDIFYAAITFWGYYAYFKGTDLANVLAAVAAAGLFCLGCYELFMLRKPVVKNPAQDLYPSDTSKNIGNAFGIGMILGSNPAFIAYWMVVATVLSSYGVETVQVAAAGLFFIGLSIGDIIWYGTFVKIVSKGIAFISSRIIRWLRVGIAAGFIIFGGLVLIALID